MKKKGTFYHCKHCKTIEFIPEGEFGIKTENLKAVYCPFVKCINKRRKMEKIGE